MRNLPLILFLITSDTFNSLKKNKWGGKTPKVLYHRTVQRLLTGDFSILICLLWNAAISLELPLTWDGNFKFGSFLCQKVERKYFGKWGNQGNWRERVGRLSIPLFSIKNHRNSSRKNLKRPYCLSSHLKAASAPPKAFLERCLPALLHYLCSWLPYDLLRCVFIFLTVGRFSKHPMWIHQRNICSWIFRNSKERQ